MMVKVVYEIKKKVEMGYKVMWDWLKVGKHSGARLLTSFQNNPPPHQQQRRPGIFLS